MDDKRLSELDEASPAEGTDMLLIARSGASYRVSVSAIIDAAAAQTIALAIALG